MERHSGILLPIFSLPSRYGIGTFGKAAYDFAAFLKISGQKYWQVLPMGPTMYGDSPYSSYSTFAGNTNFIDLQMLIEEGLLKAEEVESINWGEDLRKVDYAKVTAGRARVLALAKQRGWDRDKKEIDVFRKNNKSWLDTYALFMSLKKFFNYADWNTWPEDIRRRDGNAIKYYQDMLREDIEYEVFAQFLFFKQWKALKLYVGELGIKIIGDLPIYVSMESADVWAEPQNFKLDDDFRPIEVSGCPPDYFSEDGQLWNNPIYNYDKMKQGGYEWWIRRVGGAAELFDIIRIDHFRGFESYWSVPYGEKTAKNGRWVKGPGMDLVGTLTNWFNNLSFIAEDLGILTDDVRKLLKDSGLPGMRILEFAFSHGEVSNYLPHFYERNCICYTGTHDNAPLYEWLEESDPLDLEYVKKYCGLNKEEDYGRGVIRAGMSSVADTFIAQMQDWLKLGKGNRTNTPGTVGGNWNWRMKENEATETLAKEIYNMTDIYTRL